MAAFSVLTFLLFPLIFLINTSFSLSHKPILPQSAIIPITKELTTHQYVATVSMGPNLDPVELVLDLNGRYTWVDCGDGVNSDFSSSTSRQPIESFSLRCSMAKSTTSNCFSHGGGGGEVEHNPKICTLQAENTVSKTSASGELIETKMGVEFYDGGVGSGSFAGNGQFLFLCTSNLLLKGLASGAKGMLALDNSRISLPSQFSTKFGFLQRRFSLCLPSSSSSSSSSVGFISLGGNHPHDQSEISSSSLTMMYTPLVSKRNGLQQGYYINVNSINISGKKVSLRQQKGSPLETKLSTVVPYTVLSSEIYGTFVEAYVKAATSMNLTLVHKPVKEPFEVCFSSKGVAGPNYNVPVIELVLQSEMVKWKIFGRNSMVRVSDEVICLGFVNGGLSARDSIVLGSYQMEDCILDFNLGNNMLGFSSSSSKGENKCSDSVAAASREFL